jgi:hypothetical protein
MLIALAALAGLLAVSVSASAQSGDVRIVDGYEHVIEGDSVPINVSFSAGQSEETVAVECDSCLEWEREVVFDEQKANCEVTDAYVETGGDAQQSERICQISFPEGFENTGGGPSPVEAGEPSVPTTYDVELGEEGAEDETQFQAHLSSASTCRPAPEDGDATGIAQRTDILMLSASGYPEGEDVTLRIRDGTETIMERSFTSAGPQIAYHFRWQVPIDLDIGGSSRDAEIVVDAPSGGETEEIEFRPAVARGLIREQPDAVYNRTEGAQMEAFFEYWAAPPDCKDMNWDRDITRVDADRVGDVDLPVTVRRFNQAPSPTPVEEAGSDTASVDGTVFSVNYTIPRDEEVTDENSSDPVYDLRFDRTQLADGNYIGRLNSSEYEVYPYTIEPEYEVLQEEVERLETAELVLNLTYADGTPFTPNETSETLEIGFGPEGEDTLYTFEANHRQAGIWNVSQELDFEYEPLEPHTWRIQGIRDDNGDPGEENRIPDTVTDPVDVVSARPRLDMTTIVDGEPVIGAQRTKRVNVRVEAAFQNGVPLTEENADPSNGGLLLDINKKNEFGRVVDQDRLVLSHTGRPGVWVESFSIARSPSSAPVGEWGLEIEAKDDRDPANVNVTSFPFDVGPADVSVTDTEAPPQLVDGGDITYRFRLTYPDGSLASQEQVDAARGGQLDVNLERVSRASNPPIVERELDPRPVSGGQAWKVKINSSKVVPGNHYFNVSGRDVHGNPVGPHASDLFTVLFNGEFRNSTTPICPESNVTNQGCDVQRGETVYVVFPGASGDKGMFGDRPEIRVHRQDPESGRWVLYRDDVWLSPQQFFNLTGREAGENHVGRFTTDRSTPTDTYRLVVLGRNQDDTGFAGFSQTFNVTRVPVEREVIDPLPSNAKKTEEIGARIGSEAGDVIDTTIVEVGPVRVRNVEVDKTGLGTFLQWRPASNIPTGPASILVEGRDLFGNPFEVELGPVELQPVEIRTQQDGEIPDEAARGEPMRFNLQMTYETGTSFRGEDGQPDVVVRDLNGTRVDDGRALHRISSWEVRWTPRADLPSGEYRVAVTGTDNAGNTVDEFVTDPIQVTAGTVTGDVDSDPPANVQRGDRATAELSFPTEIAEGQATVTTGSDSVGDPRMTIDGSSVRLTFPTDRSTGLVDAFFEFTGTDVVGNNLTARSDRFSVRAQQMDVEWVEQPPSAVTTTDTAQAAFVVEYPDGSYMRPGEGTPIVGMFAVDQPLGQVEAQPSDENPVVWEVNWDPPEDTRTDVPYHFSASARDEFRNEAPPVSSEGFFVQNPVVPDYVPGPEPGLLLLALAGLALVLRRWNDQA